MGLDGTPIPGWAGPYVGWMIGRYWPEGDEERCFRLADACIDAAHRIVAGPGADRRITPGDGPDRQIISGDGPGRRMTLGTGPGRQIDAEAGAGPGTAAGSGSGPLRSGGKSERTWDGAAHAAFAEHVARVVGGREAELVTRLVGTAIAINDAGVRVRNTKHTIEATVRLTIAQLGHLLAATMTGDASTLALASARLRLARLTVAHIGERTLNDIALSTAVTADAAGGLVSAGQDHRDALDARRPATTTLAELADHVAAADDVITEERSGAEWSAGDAASGVPDADGRYLLPFLYPGLMSTGLMGGGPYGGAASSSRSPAGRRTAPASPWPGLDSPTASATDRSSSAGRSSGTASSSTGRSSFSSAGRSASTSSSSAASSASPVRDTAPGRAPASSAARPLFGLDLDLIRRSVSTPAVPAGTSRTGRPRRAPRPAPRTEPEARRPAGTEPRPVATGAEPLARAEPESVAGTESGTEPESVAGTECGTGIRNGTVVRSGTESGPGGEIGSRTGTGAEAGTGAAAEARDTAEAPAFDPSYNKVHEALAPAAEGIAVPGSPDEDAPAEPSPSAPGSPPSKRLRMRRKRRG
ncbi:hypothetical protein AB0D67_38410 [Streptosporangium sp. NPDC048047]|uniref:hypothetical protein n=1 Tax=Streptosporangium sp. NPDC048047 TaxID=3155748 RepID=UPI00342C9EAA